MINICETNKILIEISIDMEMRVYYEWSLLY